MVLRWLLINETVHGSSTRRRGGDASCPNYLEYRSSAGCLRWGVLEERGKGRRRGVQPYGNFRGWSCFRCREFWEKTAHGAQEVCRRLPSLLAAPRRGVRPPEPPHSSADAPARPHLSPALGTRSTPAPRPAPLRSHCPSPPSPLAAGRWPVQPGANCAGASAFNRAKRSKNQEEEETLRKGFPVCCDD